VEGGGATVSSFLKAGLLDRLQIAVAPLLIGDGRPAIRLPGTETLGDCLRPAHRVYRMGNDILFDCVLTGVDAGKTESPAESAVITRIL
jgi:diaminohydroxyphosphoribosylaminopyrimidine deaminase/5-amino-6-(5-phosphoribosylamino)uracil reductase